MRALFYRAAGAILAPFRYAEREVQHIKETAKEDLQAFLVNAIKIGLITISTVLFLVFISIMIAIAVNNATGNALLGWAIVAGFYLLVALILFVWKETTDKKKPAGNMPRKTPMSNDNRQ